MSAWNEEAHDDGGREESTKITAVINVKSNYHYQKEIYWPITHIAGRDTKKTSLPAEEEAKTTTKNSSVVSQKEIFCVSTCSLKTFQYQNDLIKSGASSKLQKFLLNIHYPENLRKFSSAWQSFLRCGCFVQLLLLASNFMESDKKPFGPFNEY